MKRKWIILLSVVALMMPQSMAAQGDGNNSAFWYFHKKDSNPHVTLNTKAEEIIEYLLSEPGGENFIMKKGTWLEQQRMETDGFGNVHVTYNQKSDAKAFSEYQLVLHFHPDGSLYYRNGTMILERNEAQKAKALNPASRISAESAAVIATGSPLSETVWAFANCGNKPREAYKVKDMAMMQYVYVDAYSGEVLYTVPFIRSFAPWGDVKGGAVTLSANTTYNGLQDLTVMQTDKGYILRDPERNIITIDATDVLADKQASDFPQTVDDQFKMLVGECDDVMFTSEEELRNQKYTTALRGITIWLDPEMKEVPESMKLHIYSRDFKTFTSTDIIDMDIKDAVWTEDNGRLKATLTFEDKPDIDLLQSSNITELTMVGEVYVAIDAITSGNRIPGKFLSIAEQDYSNVECLVDVETVAKQPAIDVHWDIQKVYDMYNEYFGIKGCDGKGSQIINIVNPTNNVPCIGSSGFPYNASAMGHEYEDDKGEPSYVMIYGMGGAGESTTVTALDITAHEYTHNVTAGCCNYLLYKDESGALDEALADCMAMVAEDYVLGAPTWQSGEDVMIMLDNMRNLSDPWHSGGRGDMMTKAGAQPKYYWGRFWVDYIDMDLNDPEYDHGGVHANSGVFNYLFYLLCEGGVGLTNEMDETADIIPVGMDRMKDILFHTMRYYNASLCDYAEIADNLMMAVEDIYSDDSETISDLQDKLLNAYHFVGMESGMLPTGIIRHQTDTKVTNPRTYNLFGIPVSDDYKGMVIKDGKKVFLNK